MRNVRPALPGTASRNGPGTWARGERRGNGGGRRGAPSPFREGDNIQIDEDEIVPEPQDVHAELERLEATRRWRALEIERRRERAAARREWEGPITHPVPERGSPSLSRPRFLSLSGSGSGAVGPPELKLLRWSAARQI